VVDLNSLLIFDNAVGMSDAAVLARVLVTSLGFAFLGVPVWTVLRGVPPKILRMSISYSVAVSTIPRAVFPGPFLPCVLALVSVERASTRQAGVEDLAGRGFVFDSIILTLLRAVDPSSMLRSGFQTCKRTPTLRTSGTLSVRCRDMESPFAGVGFAHASLRAIAGRFDSIQGNNKPLPTILTDDLRHRIG